MKVTWTALADDDLSHVAEIVSFLQGEFCPLGADPMWSENYMRWKLGSANPAGSGHISIAMIHDKVVGVVSLTRKRAVIDGIEHVVGEVGDSYSSAAIRRTAGPETLSTFESGPNSYVNKSIFGRLASDVRRRAEASGVAVIYGTPNVNAYPGWTKRLDYVDFLKCNNYSFTRPTPLILENRGKFLNAAIPLLNGADHIFLSSAKAFLHRRAAKRFVINQAFPSVDELDILWTELKPTLGFALVRDGAYWLHRYIEHPLFKYLPLAVRQDGRLVGLVVTRLVKLSETRRTVLIAEWMLHDNVDFGYMLSQVIDCYSNQQIHTFSIWSDKRSNDSLKARQLLFIPRFRVPIILANNTYSTEMMEKCDKFEFYLGSSDAV